MWIIHTNAPQRRIYCLVYQNDPTPLIDIQLATDFNTITHKPPLVIYTGAIDEYFQFKLGKLAWRSLSFDFQVKTRLMYKTMCKLIIRMNMIIHAQ